ncbi:MAG: EAL domain-containing protein [Sulfuricellaceae bacterium]|nr:EAL domain-containing protein [Sulfuricellaceae bacterium]
MANLNSRYLIATASSLAVALMLALTFIGLTRMEIIKHELESVILINSKKTELVSQMRTVARERVVMLYQMSMQDDPFERDEILQRYQDLAVGFIQMRSQLEIMQMSNEEQYLLAKALNLIVSASGFQEQALESLNRADLASAHQALLESVIPIQNRVFEVYSRLLAAQQKQTSAAISKVEETYRFARMFFFVSGLTAVLLILAVTVYVIRRILAYEEALYREKEQAQVTLSSIGEAVVSTDARGRVNFLNPIAEFLTGWSRQEAEGKTLREVFHLVDEATREPLIHIVDEFMPDSAVAGFKRNSLLLRRDGREFIVEDKLSPISNRVGDVIGAVVVFRDVTQERHMASQLSWQATHDALTGLLNRREFERLLQEKIENAAMGDRQHALLFADLDQFKIVNDTCGHMAGDELLRQLVTVFVARSRNSDAVARLGGDEFGLLLIDCPEEAALRLANEIREEVQAFRFVWQDKIFEIGVSIGLVPITAVSGDMALVMSHADAACYAAKDRGRNHVHVYVGSDTELARRHGEMQWISRISLAFEEHRFRLFYQKIVQVHPPGSPDPDPFHTDDQHYEVLIRLIDENGSIVPPGAFIPAAERYKVMPNLDRWVIRTLFVSHSKKWRQQWDAAAANGEPCPLLVGINLSGASLNDDLFPTFLKEQIAEHDIPPQILCFELTETSAIANLNRASQFMHELSRLGCQFSLDDFGSGMSSFAYLKGLPVHFVKIDGAFVRGMEENPINHAMVEAIVRVASVMGIKTVAEFVETPELLDKLAVLGVDYAQGYGIHKPEPLADTLYGHL